MRQLQLWDAHIAGCAACLERLGKAGSDASSNAQEAWAPTPWEWHQLLVQAAALEPGARETSPSLELDAGSAERFVPLRLIATGGMGEVFLGADRETGRHVAIKRLLARNLTLPAALARFAREGQILEMLEHPNIVKTLAIPPGERPSIVMEFMPGGSLRRLLRSERTPPLARSVRVLLEIADALARAHHLEVIHRDIKPENVLLTERGNPCLADFGLARGAERDLSSPGTLLGTVAYSSPEVLRGQDATERSDLWSLGVMSFEMIAGSRPFSGDSVAATFAAILERPPPDLALLRPGAPTALVDLIRRMLEKDPRQRIRSARQVGAELEAILVELPPRACPRAGQACARARCVQFCLAAQPSARSSAPGVS